MNMCRACLSSENDLFESDDSFVCNYNLLTDLNVKPFDGKSQKFCKTCVETVNFFIDFRTKCASAESTLQEISSEQIIKPEKLNEAIIKGEIKYEYDEESYDVPFQGYDADEGNSDFIKLEIDANDVKVKKSRKKIKKQVSVSKKKQVSVCKKKQVSVCKKVAEVTATKKAEGNLVLTTDKPACGEYIEKYYNYYVSNVVLKNSYIKVFDTDPDSVAFILIHSLPASRYVHKAF